jgi:glutathione S-transferase
VARHPFGKIPAFEHDSFRLYEAGAIARYIDEAFAGVPLQPADVRGRARMTQIIRSGCCACPASGHAAAAPPRRTISSRRFN